MKKVLVCIGYTDIKHWCRPLVPRIYEDLTYKNKELLFVTKENCVGLDKLHSGEEIAATIRNMGIREARKGDFDYIFFCDVDTIPDVDIIEKLIETGKPMVGGAHAARGNAELLIGHYYRNYRQKERIPLNFRGVPGTHEVEGISGGLLLVHRSIFKEIDYSGYKGPDTIPGRFTADDEFYQIKTYERLKIKPWVCLDTGGYHLHDDGFAYRYYGKKESYKLSKNEIVFKGKTYEAGC